MSGVYPAYPGASTITIGDAPGSDALKSLSQSGVTFTRFMNRHRWAIKATYNYLNADQGRDLKAFIDSQQGGDKFQFVAAHMAPRGIAAGTPLVNGAGQTGYNLVTDGWTINTTNIMRKDDIIKVGNHSRVYKLSADVNSNSLGQATLILATPLRIATTDNDIITVRNVPFTVALSTVPEFTVRSPHWYAIEISMIEEF